MHAHVNYIRKDRPYGYDMAKADEIGTSSIKKCLLLGISTRFSKSFLKQRRWKGLTEMNYIVLY